MVRVEDIDVLHGLQFRARHNTENGLTASKEKRLEKVETYDVEKGGTLTVWQDLKGNYFVADGHHRLFLAKNADE